MNVNIKDAVTCRSGKLLTSSNTSYNLRSVKRNKNNYTRNCYLQNFSENISPEAYNPKVCLKRLKLLDSHDIQNSVFYLEKGRIIIKKNKSNSSDKKYLLKLFCIVAVILTSLVYWRDNWQNNCLYLTRKYKEIHPRIQSYYSDFFNFHNSTFKDFTYNEQKSNYEIVKPIAQVLKENFTLLQENFEIRQLVQDCFIEIKKKNKVRNSVKSVQSFIEEQCNRDGDYKSYTKKRAFNNTSFHNLSNLTDYALESEGAEIVTVFNTELYSAVTVKYLNINLGTKISHFLTKYLKWVSLNGPNSILQPWKKPGDCWAFKGSNGKVQIKLSEEIVITAVTVEHIPKEIHPKGMIQSAPKKFSLYGVGESGREIIRTYFGSFEYEITGPGAQTFFLQPRAQIPFKLVEFEFKSNHGNELYTCIYKIRIHGFK